VLRRDYPLSRKVALATQDVGEELFTRSGIGLSGMRLM
jgi:hypothetical protein